MFYLGSLQSYIKKKRNNAIAFRADFTLSEISAEKKNCSSLTLMCSAFTWSFIKIGILGWERFLANREGNHWIFNPFRSNANERDTSLVSIGSDELPNNCAAVPLAWTTHDLVGSPKSAMKGTTTASHATLAREKIKTASFGEPRGRVQLFLNYSSRHNN